MPSPSSLAQFFPLLYHGPDAGRLSPAVLAGSAALADICVGLGSAAAPVSSVLPILVQDPCSGWAEVVLSIF